jgi:predicted GNAT family N-acyltransferase
MTDNWYQFNDLTASQLYDILQLRELVFTIGQKCSEPDIDDVDRTAMHYVKYAGDKLVAYLRVYSADNQLKLYYPRQLIYYLPIIAGLLTVFFG